MQRHCSVRNQMKTPYLPQAELIFQQEAAKLPMAGLFDASKISDMSLHAQHALLSLFLILSEIDPSFTFIETVQRLTPFIVEKLKLPLSQPQKIFRTIREIPIYIRSNKIAPTTMSRAQQVLNRTSSCSAKYNDEVDRLHQFLLTVFALYSAYRPLHRQRRKREPIVRRKDPLVQKLDRIFQYDTVFINNEEETDPHAEIHFEISILDSPPRNKVESFGDASTAVHSRYTSLDEGIVKKHSFSQYNRSCKATLLREFLRNAQSPCVNYPFSLEIADLTEQIVNHTAEATLKPTVKTSRNHSDFLIESLKRPLFTHHTFKR